MRYLIRADLRPRPYEHVERVRPAAAERGDARGHTRRAQHAEHLPARAPADGAALDAHGNALAFDAVHERLGKRPDDGGDVVRLTPVVAVPPDVVAPVHVRRGRADRCLDAVDVVEPVDGRAAFVAAGDAVDALHEAAAVARAHPRVAYEHAHDGLFATHRGRAPRTEHARAEVARDEQLHTPRGAARAKPTARERHDEDSREPGGEDERDADSTRMPKPTLHGAFQRRT